MEFQNTRRLISRQQDRRFSPRGPLLSLKLSLEALEDRRLLAANVATLNSQLPMDTADTALIGQDRVRVIVQLTEREAADAVLARVDSIASDVQRMSQLPILVLELPESALDDLARAPHVVSVTRDVAVPYALASTLPVIRANSLHAIGFDGTGTTIAILDTGIDDDHDFFGANGSRIVAERCFSGATGGSRVSLCPNGQTIDTQAQVVGVAACMNGAENLCDHGTHVAGIAAGSGASDPNAQGTNGVAPSARVIAMQVFTRFNDDTSCGGAGRAPCVLSFQSNQLSALNEVLALDIANPSWNIVAANMSLGGGMHTAACDEDPLKVAIDALLANGVATVIAAGNNGFDAAVSAPGCISTAFTVGNTTDSDAVASTSNRGTLLDVFAPGSGVDSSVPNDAYANLNGTSMAAPHVAGALAVLRQAFPTSSMADLMFNLKHSGVTVVYSSGGVQVITRRIDVLNALGDDHGQSAFNASSFGSFQSTSGIIEAAGGSDWFKFSAIATAYVTLETSLGTLTDTTLTLYGSDGTTPLAFDDDGGPGRASRINFNVNGSGVYYAKVAGYQNLGGSYGFSLTHVDDHGRNAATATPIAGRSTTDGSIEVNMNVDWFSFYAAAGASVTLETTLITLPDSTLRLYDSDGTTQTQLAYDDNGGFGMASRIQWAFAATGQYFVQVAGFGIFYNLNRGSYNLAFTYVDDHGGDSFSATGTAVGTDNPGTLQVSGDTDWFSFPANNGISYDLSTALGSLPDSTLTLYDTDGFTELAFNDDYGSLASRIFWAAPATGTYYLKVEPFGSEEPTGSYSLAISLLGDFNNNGAFTCEDIDSLITTIAASKNNPIYDMNGDQVVNLADRDVWLAAAGAFHLGLGRGYLLGDANLDGVVDGSDFGVWNSHKFTSVAAWCSGDFTADGVVDGSDFGVWNSHKFTSSDAASDLRTRSPSVGGTPSIASMDRFFAEKFVLADPAGRSETSQPVMISWNPSSVVADSVTARSSRAQHRMLLAEPVRFGERDYETVATLFSVWTTTS
jgi:subtilisin family serine protease